MIVGWFNGKLWCDSSQEEEQAYTDFVIEFSIDTKEIEGAVHDIVGDEKAKKIIETHSTHDMME